MIYFASVTNTINDLISATNVGISWAISVSIFVTAVLMAIALINYLIQRS